MIGLMRWVMSGLRVNAVILVNSENRVNEIGSLQSVILSRLSEKERMGERITSHH